ncbi:MAG: ABC transporter ATP-binding protein [Spirochaetota bacterium]
MARVVLQNVSKRYGDFEAVKDLSFECHEAEFFFILGPSGAGKTTIISLIAGILPITRGEIYIGDRMVNKVQPRFRDVAVAYEAYALYPNLNVYGNMAFPLRAPIRKAKYSHEEIDKTVRNIAAILQIEDLLEKLPGQLSGGQKQRVALGRTLVRHPAVYLLDEPIAHLDAKLRHRMRGELKRLQRQIGVSAIFATPDQSEAVSMADRIAVINKGELHQIGTPKELFDNPLDLFVATSLGDPKMNILDGKFTKTNGELFFHTNDLKLAIPSEIKTRLEKKSIPEEIKLGIRPVDFNISKEKRTPVSLKAEVEFVQSMGGHQVLTLKFNKELIKTKLSLDQHFAAGEKPWIDVNMNKAYFFDKKTGLTVLSPGTI